MIKDPAVSVTAAIPDLLGMSSLLYGVSPTDPMTFVGMTTLLCAAAVAATYLPARRASRLDPIRVLRQEWVRRIRCPMRSGDLK